MVFSHSSVSLPRAQNEKNETTNCHKAEKIRKYGSLLEKHGKTRLI